MKTIFSALRNTWNKILRLCDPCTWRKGNCDKCRELEAKIEEYNRLYLLSANAVTGNTFQLELRNDILVIVASVMTDIMKEKEAEAPNYIEVFLDSGNNPEIGPLVLTIQKMHGKSPHQLRQEAEKNAENYKKIAEKLREKLNEIEAKPEKSNMVKTIEFEKELSDKLNKIEYVNSEEKAKP